jgi:anthranilate synthase component 2
MQKILVLDNYDSFVYNLVQYVEEIVGYDIAVFRNNEISLDAVADYDRIILSPGPSVPSEAGIMLELIKRYAPTKKIFGVCLGQQAIGEAFGARLINLNKVYHGIASEIQIIDKEEIIFKGLAPKIQVGRYHSWVVERESIPNSLIVTAEDENGQIMGLRHKIYDVRGVQFHPESIMTPDGKQMLRNWLNDF